MEGGGGKGVGRMEGWNGRTHSERVGGEAFSADDFKG
jgi:hypothetical protein